MTSSLEIFTNIQVMFIVQVLAPHDVEADTLLM